MKYLLSMDGGGTKTQFLLTAETGETAATYRTGGCSHPQLGIQAVLELIHEGIEEVTGKVGCSKEDIVSAAFGVPCYREYPDIDKMIFDDLQQYLKTSIVTVHNDVDLGFAGSLGLEDGIHLVAGTGAIAVGRNSAGKMAQSNGWHPYFSDDGSGYWLGMQTLSLFAKQADYRVPRSALYSIVRQECSLSDDQDIILYYDNNLAGKRGNTAAMQLLLKKAALAGDESAIQLYEAAAYELYLTVGGVYKALSFSPEDRIKISYSGGLFSEGNFIMKPFAKLVAQLSAELVEPYLSPAQGGILLAMQSLSKENAIKIGRYLKETSAEGEINGNN